MPRANSHLERSEGESKDPAELGLRLRNGMESLASRTLSATLRLDFARND